MDMYDVALSLSKEIDNLLSSFFLNIKKYIYIYYHNTFVRQFLNQIEEQVSSFLRETKERDST
jgi:hypothetical protein